MVIHFRIHHKKECWLRVKKCLSQTIFENYVNIKIKIKNFSNVYYLSSISQYYLNISSMSALKNRKHMKCLHSRIFVIKRWYIKTKSMKRVVRTLPLTPGKIEKQNKTKQNFKQLSSFLIWTLLQTSSPTNR